MQAKAAARRKRLLQGAVATSREVNAVFSTAKVPSTSLRPQEKLPRGKMALSYVKIKDEPTAGRFAKLPSDLSLRQKQQQPFN